MIILSSIESTYVIIETLGKTFMAGILRHGKNELSNSMLSTYNIMLNEITIHRTHRLRSDSQWSSVNIRSIFSQ